MRPGTVALVSLAAALAAVFLYAFDPAQGGPYPVCFFHQTTGLLCPGCGGLRALHQLLHGRLAAALYLNPMLVLGLPVATWVGGGAALRAWRGQPAALVIRPAWLWFAGGVLLAFCILRNLPWPPLAWLGLHP